MIDFDALEKEMAELNEVKKAWDKAFDRAWEIWGIVSKNQDEYYKWQKKKTSVQLDKEPQK
jgi:hypothetical protein